MDDVTYFVYVDELCHSHRRSIVNNDRRLIGVIAEELLSAHRMDVMFQSRHIATEEHLEALIGTLCHTRDG